MTAKKIFLILILVSLLITGTAQADDVAPVTIQAMNVNQYSLTASPNYVIYQIIVDALPMGTNQTHVLNSNGATFLLTIKTAQSWYIYNDFWVTMQYPNGSVDTVHKQSVRVSDNTYRTTIQPVFAQMQSVTPAWKIDLNVGLNPTTVMFTPNNILMFDPSTSIPFSSASGEFSGQTTNVFCEQILQTVFTKNITDYNALYGLGSLASQVLGWSWDLILNFIGRIPIIGPQFKLVMVLMYQTAAVIIFWLLYVANNIFLILFSGEILLMLFAFLLAGKRPTPEKFVKNLVSYNVRTVTGFIWLVSTVYEWGRSFVSMVSGIIH